MAKLFGERGVRFDFLLDEGMAVTEEQLPVPAPVALIGLSEKGFLNVELKTKAAGGHSSMPPKQTAVGQLATALARLAARPMTSQLDGPMQSLFATIAPEVDFGKRLVFANLWLFSPLVEAQLSEKPSTDASIRTTTAETVVQAGIRDNVLPQEARAIVNFRIHPSDSIAGVLEHVKRTIDDDGVEVTERPGASEPSPVSPAEGPAYERLARTIRSVFPEALVAPAMVLGATDARQYASLTDCAYRFSPQRIRPNDRPRLHGNDERMAVQDYARAVQFYAQFLRGL
jgi:carboxypeptidase PM20D1